MENNNNSIRLGNIWIFPSQDASGLKYYIISKAYDDNNFKRIWVKIHITLEEFLLLKGVEI